VRAATILKDDDVWFGLNDRTTEDTFVYTDNTSVSFTDWISSDPNNCGPIPGGNNRCGNANCVRLVVSNDGIGMWADGVCSVSYSSICKCAHQITSNQKTTTNTISVPDATAPTMFYVEACSTVGCSASTTSASTTVPNNPASVTVGVSGDKQVQVTIEPPLNDGGANSITYLLKFYIFNPTEQTWLESENACTSHGTSCHLASIRNAEENNIVLSKISSKWSAWFGLNDRENEGTFVNIDNTPKTFVDWHPNTGTTNKQPEPNNFNGNEDCGEIHGLNSTSTTPPGKWRDKKCSKNQSSICNAHTG
jgi:hypothetical protein